jgi:glycosyltransferase involved in cell wall biosynthesis
MRGWTRYALQLLRHLPPLGAELVLFTDRPLRAEYLELLEPGSFRVLQSPTMRYISWEQLWLPVACARASVDLLHSPSNYGLPALAACPTVLTLHDAIDVAFQPRTTSPSARERLVRASFWTARKKARSVITVSAHAKKELIRFFSIPEARISVIPEASDLTELPSLDEENTIMAELGLSEPFVLYAGGFERRKNVPFLVDAFLSADIGGAKLVLVGSRPPDDLRRSVAARGAADRVVFTGFVPDATLISLYRRALAFVYPSLYEGFGLQLCEAMSLGCPVLAADVTSLPEVLGAGGDTFSPHDIRVLRGMLERVHRDPGYRADLCARAEKRALDFSWRRTAELTYDVYLSCVRD